MLYPNASSVLISYMDFYNIVWWKDKPSYWPYEVSERIGEVWQCSLWRLKLLDGAPVAQMHMHLRVTFESRGAHFWFLCNQLSWSVLESLGFSSKKQVILGMFAAEGVFCCDFIYSQKLNVVFGLTNSADTPIWTRGEVMSRVILMVTHHSPLLAC